MPATTRSQTKNGQAGIVPGLIREPRLTPRRPRVERLPPNHDVDDDEPVLMMGEQQLVEYQDQDIAVAAEVLPQAARRVLALSRTDATFILIILAAVPMANFRISISTTSELIRGSLGGIWSSITSLVRQAMSVLPIPSFFSSAANQVSDCNLLHRISRHQARLQAINPLAEPMSWFALLHVDPTVWPFSSRQAEMPGTAENLAARQVLAAAAAAAAASLTQFGNEEMADIIAATVGLLMDNQVRSVYVREILPRLVGNGLSSGARVIGEVLQKMCR